MKRSQMKRRRMRQGPSARQAAKDVEWTEARLAWLVQHPRCKVRLSAPGVCFGRMEVHHVLLRSQGGKNDGSTPLMTLCTAHHEWAHLNKAEATKVGARVGASDREAR